jgi:serine/threonine protein kinase
MPILEASQRFERYRIIQWLGSSASGESYEAEDTMLFRRVTLKLIHPATTLPDAARRQFFREMQDISILNHPYLAHVLDYGEFDGKLYVARRFVSNGSLLGHNGRLWFQGPLDVYDAVHYGYQLAQALQHIHNRGCLHGSLTMANILVLQVPKAENKRNAAPFLLADVGITHFARRLGEKCSTLLAITAAPEQFYKRSIQASDQFALAVILYYWLVGHLPYIGTSEEIVQLKLTETIRPLSSFNASITLEQEEVIGHALSVSPEDRYQSVQAFADALLATLAPKNLPVVQTETADLIESNFSDTTERALQLPADDSSESTQQREPETEISGENNAIIAHLLIFSPYIQAPYSVELRDEVMTIGRAGSSDILLDRDDLTSRHHALLKREIDRFMIYDRRSANGVQVNGQQIQIDHGFPLENGDTITIGHYELTIRIINPTGIDQGDSSLATPSWIQS